MNLPKPEHWHYSKERHFISLKINGSNYTIMLFCKSGYPSTMEDPGEESEIEIEKIFDANGVDISDKIIHEDWSQLHEWINNPPKKNEIEYNNDKIIL